MENYGVEIHNKSYPSLKDSRKKIIEEIIKEIKNNRISISLSNDELYLVIDEALTNAMEHGNQWNPNKLVSVRVVKNSKYMNIMIGDEGTGFRSDALQHTQDSVRNLKPRGRGIYIIRQFCQPSWNQSGNQITLQFKVN